jgi:DMSO/TMAO reductase YedYZ molybdopterin-dependent catalytic subunit
MRPLPLAHAARSLAAVGLVELALAARGRSVLDDLGEVVIDHSPLPLVELGVQLMGTTDKPLLRLQSLAALVASGTVLGARAAPGHGRVSRRTTTLGVAGVAALAAARVVLARQQPQVRAELARPSAAVSDGADAWDASPMVTPVEDFYVTDVTMRAPVVDAAAWRLEVEAADGARAVVDADRLAGLDLQERQALLACVHNRPGWDRLGQQSWTGLPLPDLLAALGLPVPDAEDESLDLVMEGADGLVMTLPWPEVVVRRSWLVTGMGGRPLTASHGHPARVLTAGLPGQYGGPKWVTALRLRPAGSVTASWVARGWPRGPVVVPLMARIDSLGTVGMPPRLPLRAVRVGSRDGVSGVAWASTTAPGWPPSWPATSVRTPGAGGAHRWTCRPAPTSSPSGAARATGPSRPAPADRRTPPVPTGSTGCR